MSRWLPRVLGRARRLASQGSLDLTHKARLELDALDLGLDSDDACGVVASLEAEDFAVRLRSERTGEWTYVFRPTVADTLLYVKLILRTRCIVVSLHEAEEQDEDDR